MKHTAERSLTRPVVMRALVVARVALLCVACSVSVQNMIGGEKGIAASWDKDATLLDGEATLANCSKT